jgi:hypothetical protein
MKQKLIPVVIAVVCGGFGCGEQAAPKTCTPEEIREAVDRVVADRYGIDPSRTEIRQGEPSPFSDGTVKVNVDVGDEDGTVTFSCSTGDPGPGSFERHN